MESRIWIAPLMLAAAFVMQPTASHAQSAIGKASSVKPQADGSIAGTLAAGSSVHASETVKTGSAGQANLRFNDSSNLSVGPSSSVRLDKFVYDSDKKAGTIVLDLTKGAFRFITGVATKPTYLIRTPNASITVRGTIFDSYILPDNSAWFLLHDGGIEVTAAKNVCHVLDRPGQLIRVISARDMHRKERAIYEQAD